MAREVEAEFVEALRRRALDEDAPVEPFLSEAARAVDVSSEQLTTFLDELRRHYRINRRAASRQKERITRTGFTLEEQVLTLETALRMMGLVRNFARLVLFCAHGSTTENNPFESALDCGACGGNEGKPNARVLAAMANRAPVRERRAKRGIIIPPDNTWPGLHRPPARRGAAGRLEDRPLLPRRGRVAVRRADPQRARAGRAAAHARHGRAATDLIDHRLRIPFLSFTNDSAATCHRWPAPAAMARATRRHVDGAARLARLLDAPHRLGMFAGAVMLAAAALGWGAMLALRAAGVAVPWAVSPTTAHAVLMVCGCVPFFFAGFLFTAGPRWLGLPPVAARSLVLPIAQYKKLCFITYFGKFYDYFIYHICAFMPRHAASYIYTTDRSPSYGIWF